MPPEEESILIGSSAAQLQHVGGTGSEGGLRRRRRVHRRDVADGDRTAGSLVWVGRGCLKRRSRGWQIEHLWCQIRARLRAILQPGHPLAIVGLPVVVTVGGRLERVGIELGESVAISASGVFGVVSVVGQLFVFDAEVVRFDIEVKERSHHPLDKDQGDCHRHPTPGGDRDVLEGQGAHDQWRRRTRVRRNSF